MAKDDKSPKPDEPAPPPAQPVFRGEGIDPFRPADNMVPGYDAHAEVQPGVRVGPAVDPNAGGAPADDKDDDRPSASMSMTKAELLDCLRERAEGMTKAEILDVIEGLDADPDADAPAAPRSYATDIREATIDGQHYVWTEESEHTVPQAAREIYAQHKAAGG